MDEQALEKEITDKGLNAPRITPKDIDEQIVFSQYYVFENTTVTVCCLHLRNGYTVVGESAAVSMENFDRETGQKVAFSNAREKIWTLEGYRLKQHLYDNRGEV